MANADRPADLPEVGRIAGRILSTLAPWADTPPTRADIEQVSRRIASGLDGMYLGPHRALAERYDVVQGGVTQLKADHDAARSELDDLRVDAGKLLDKARAWHHQQPDHLGWTICQHPICRAIQEFPWE